ncbi:MAG TPA: TIR domain-containing protein [Vicinamibacterales bacterium]
MADLFISHSSADDGFVRSLHQRLEEHGVSVWIDSRQLAPGGRLEPDIAHAIENATAFAVVVSPNSLQSKWVGKELRLALDVQRRRGHMTYAVVPLSLDGTKLGVLEEFFEGEPIYLPMSSAAGGVEAGMHGLLIALGKRLPSDNVATIEQIQEPLEELQLELSDFRMQTVDSLPRASARARLVYEPGTAGMSSIATATSWRLVAPLGALEIDELRWYVETFSRWPHEYFRDRARAVERNLATWGQRLYTAAVPAALAADVKSAWHRRDPADRRFSVLVDAEGELEAGAPAAAVKAAQEIGAAFLKLPWELLHDGQAHVFQGARPVCVRRRLPNIRGHDIAAVAPPIRVLVVSPRPEDDTCAYFDHRAGTLPLVDALEGLGDLVQFRVLTPPTLAALREEIDRAHTARQPYHVIHVDGYGTYDRTSGAAALCFEEPQDLVRLSKRRHALAAASELGTLFGDQGIAVVFLDIRQTSGDGIALEAIASDLLRVGVASIVTMRYQAPAETTRRTVAAFYGTLASGGRVGDAVLEAQRRLKDDNYRGVVPGAGEARVDDWFTPGLHQIKDDVQLFRATPGRQTEKDIYAALEKRLGRLPEQSVDGFTGRSRDLLALERLLRTQRYAVLCGPIGAGKTALAVEFARWMVRSRRFERAAFVATDAGTTPETWLHTVGAQLLGPAAVGSAADVESWIKAIERTLLDRPTLLVVDDVERLLPPPYIAADKDSPEATATGFAAIGSIVGRLAAVGATRIAFVSRERLPDPFGAPVNRLEMDPLTLEEAVELVERRLTRFAVSNTRQDIEEIVGLLHGHAGTLARLAVPALQMGVADARNNLDGLLAEIERRFPGDDRRSPIASAEHQLARMSPRSRSGTPMLAPFAGGVPGYVLKSMTDWDDDDLGAVLYEIVQTGLGTMTSESYVTLVPPLTAALRRTISEDVWKEIETRWRKSMREYGAFLMTTGRKDAPRTAATVSRNLPNFLALLERDEQSGDIEATIGTATSLITNLQVLGRPALVERVTRTLQTAAGQLTGGWSRALFQALHARIDQLVDEGQVARACDTADQLVALAKTGGPSAYEGAEFDIASAHLTLSRALQVAGRAQEALPPIDEALSHFRAVQDERLQHPVAVMIATCRVERADCFAALGRLEEAAGLYEQGISELVALHDERTAAVAAAEFGGVRRQQRRFTAALAAFETARDFFTRVNEPASVANAYGEIARTYRAMERFSDAEETYRKALEIRVRVGDRTGEAAALSELASLYSDHLNRPEDAVAFDRRAAETFARLGDQKREALVRNNLAATLLEIGRYDEARPEVERAIECKKLFGPDLRPWTSWDILSLIEVRGGNNSAAASARLMALDVYLAYRRGGGEDNQGPGRLTAEVTRQIQTGGLSAARTFLEQLAADPSSNSDLKSFIGVLEEILDGKGDPATLRTLEMGYAAAVEAILLLENLSGLTHTPPSY